VETFRYAESGSEYLALRYRRRSGATDVSFRAQYSTDLVTWRDNSQGAYTVEVSAVADEEGLELVTVRSAVSLASAPAQFLRIHAFDPAAGLAPAVTLPAQTEETSEPAKRRSKTRRIRVAR
jgi:hypothetical protein